MRRFPVGERWDSLTHQSLEDSNIADLFLMAESTLYWCARSPFGEGGAFARAIKKRSAVLLASDTLPGLLDSLSLGRPLAVLTP